LGLGPRIPKPCVASWCVLTYLLTNPVSRTRFRTNVSGLDCRSYRLGRPSPHVDGMEEVRQEHSRLAERRSRRPPLRSAPLGPYRGAVHPKRRIRVRWAAPDVQIHRARVQLIHKPVVSDLDLSLRPSHRPVDPSQMLLSYTAKSGSPSQYARRASWPAGP
jgi:hypothetical protein